jgi:hypothetical protein
VPSSHVSAQATLTVTNNNLKGTVTPDVNAFLANNNQGRNEDAGSITLRINDCPGNITKCSIAVAATGLPAVGRPQFVWSVTAPPASGNIVCTPQPSSTVTTTFVAVVECVTNNGNAARTASGIVVSFSYPVSWIGAPVGTSATSGLRFRLTVP